MLAILISASFLTSALAVLALAQHKLVAACRRQADADATYLDARDLHAEAEKRLLSAHEYGSRVERKYGGLIVH